MTRIVEAFLQGNLSVLLILISLIAGAVALWITPQGRGPSDRSSHCRRDSEHAGGFRPRSGTAVATRLEKLLYQIDGVEYV